MRHSEATNDRSSQDAYSRFASATSFLKDCRGKHGMDQIPKRHNGQQRILQTHQFDDESPS